MQNTKKLAFSTKKQYNTTRKKTIADKTTAIVFLFKTILS